MFHVKRFIILALFIPFGVCAQHMGTTVIEVKEFPPLPSRNISIDKFLDQFPETGSLSKLQREWFYWTNYSRENPRRFWDSVVFPLLKSFPALDNSYSQSLKKDLYKVQSLPFVKPNASLALVSGKLAKELASKKAAPSHTSPSGSTFEDRMKEAAIKFCAGENISFGPDNPVFMLTLLYIDQGVPDLGHRKTLLDPTYVEMGIGAASYPDKKWMVIQEFACNQKK